MTTSEDINDRRAQAFMFARDTVRAWRQTGRRTTTAGVTSVMKQAGQMDLELLGLTANKDFWDHAAASGLVEVEQQTNGHWYVLLPGEKLADFEVPNTPEALPVVPVDPELRLKSDVWTSFVDWNLAFRRFWDRSHARAFMVPTSPGWIPDSIDPSRFTEIEPALQDRQIEWMKAFAAERPEPDRTALLISLADHAPRGSFRRELRERGLGRAWREVLRVHILDTAVAWARDSNIDVALIVETHHREVDPPAARPVVRGMDVGQVVLRIPYAQTGAKTGTQTGQADAQRSGPGSTSTLQSGASAPGVGSDSMSSDSTVPRPVLADGADRTAVLRDRLHRVIDRMSWEDLSRIPLRAEHLLDS